MFQQQITAGPQRQPGTNALSVFPARLELGGFPELLEP